MIEKKPWTEAEDELLKSLRDNPKPMKWASISVYMYEKKKFPKRTGKQYRERYQNYLNPENCRQEWTTQQIESLFQYHNEYGNQWSLIGKKLNDRTDNCVKNKFYSKLKKTLRRINNAIQKFLKKEFSIFKPKILYNIVEASQDRFENELVNQNFVQFSTNLKIQLQIQSFREVQFSNYEVPEVKQLIQNICKFAKEYKKKKKPKKKPVQDRHHSILVSLPPQKDKFKSNDLSQYYEESQISEIDEESQITLEKESQKSLTVPIESIEKESVFLETESVDFPLQNELEVFESGKSGDFGCNWWQKDVPLISMEEIQREKKDNLDDLFFVYTQQTL